MATDSAVAASNERGTLGAKPTSDNSNRGREIQDAGKLPTLKGWLLRLAIGGFIGSLLISALTGWYSWHSERQLLNQNLTATSRALLQAADRELGSPVALSRGLGASVFLEGDDLTAFDSQARRALAPYRYQLVLARSGSTQELINTELPTGTRLPKLPTSWPLTASKLDAVTVLPFQKSAASGRWVLPVGVPIMDSGRHEAFIIWILVPSTVFQRLIDQQKLPPGWSAVLLDSNWTIMARYPSIKRYLGRKGAAPQQRYTWPVDTVYEVHTLEGTPSFASRSRSDVYQLTAAVSVSEAKAFARFLPTAAMTALGTLAVTVLIVGGALLFIARLARDVRDLSAASEAVGQETNLAVPATSVREVAVLGQSLRLASSKIRTHRNELETKIRAVTEQIQHEERERRAAQKALSAAQRLEALGQLTGGLAHDFNNLLTILSGNLQLIRSKTSQDEIKCLAENALKGADKSARLIESLLAFARKKPLNLQVVNPNDLINEFLPLLEGAAGKGVDIRPKLDPAIKSCLIDPPQFQSALLNLVSNARSAMPKGGHICIESLNATELPQAAPPLEGAYVCISVSDTGSGIPPDVAARVFDPFFTTKEEGKGTGLGLSQVYGFAKHSDGHVDLITAPGAGTTVRIWLPCQ